MGGGGGGGGGLEQHHVRQSTLMGRQLPGYGHRRVKGGRYSSSLIFMSAAKVSFLLQECKTEAWSNRKEDPLANIFS